MPQNALTLSREVDECKPLPLLRRARVEREQFARQRALRQGLTLVHFSAQRKHILWDTFGA